MKGSGLPFAVCAGRKTTEQNAEVVIGSNALDIYLGDAHF
jgi:hypothetical protein